MATLTVNALSRTVFNLTDNDAAAAAGGDQFANTGKEAVYFLNSSVGDITVTFVIQATVDGAAVTNPTQVVPAGEAVLVGPFPPAIYTNSSTGRMSMTYSGVTTFFVAVVQLTPV